MPNPTWYVQPFPVPSVYRVSVPRNSWQKLRLKLAFVLLNWGKRLLLNNETLGIKVEADNA